MVTRRGDRRNMEEGICISSVVTKEDKGKRIWRGIDSVVDIG